MKTIAAGIAGLMIATSAAQAAPADYDKSAAPTCLWTYRIDHTTYVKPNVLLFHMKDGTTYQNTLKTSCRGLAFHGFVYETHTDSICSNAQSIRLLETNQVCLLGAFSPVEKPVKGADKS